MFEDRDQQFFRTVFSRRVRFTYVFFGMNILLFLLMELAGGSENTPTLIAFGAKYNPAIDRGEIWRFITPTFLHIGLVHVAVNSFSLWNIGPAVEKFYGEARFVILYILSGVGAALASYLISPRAVAAGASGSILGLCGVLVVFGLRNKETIPANYRKFLLQNLIASVVLTMFLGFRYGGGAKADFAIDNAAHIGGFVTGALLAGIIPFDNPFKSTGKSALVFRAVRAVCLLSVVLSFGAVAMNYNGPKADSLKALKRWNPLSKAKSDIQKFIDALNEAQGAHAESLNSIQSGNTKAVEEANRNTAKAIEKLRATPSLGQSADRWVQELLVATQEEYALEREVLQSEEITPELAQRIEKSQLRFHALDNEINAWIAEEGDLYGIGNGPPK